MICKIVYLFSRFLLGYNNDLLIWTKHDSYSPMDDLCQIVLINFTILFLVWEYIGIHFTKECSLPSVGSIIDIEKMSIYLHCVAIISQGLVE